MTEIILTGINGLVSILGIIITALVTNSLTKYRIGLLEQKVEKHNNVIERVYKLEQRVEDIDE